jgi:PAS domain S-box-containing protein
MPIATNGAATAKQQQADLRRVNQALARVLADLDMRGEVLAPFDRASELLSALVPSLHGGDADAARAAVLGSDLPTRELLDLVLRARLGVRRRRGPPQERAERERAADAALRALADREDPARPEDLDRRRQIAAQHRRLLALLTDGVVIVRPKGQLLHANRAAREAIGLRLRDLKDTPLVSLFARRPEGKEFCETLKAEGVARPREAELRSKAGRTFPVRIAGARVEGPDPRILVVFRDMTEIRHIRSRLLETEKLGAMAKIAGSVAHEIRNPLNALFLNADLLEDELREHGDVGKPIDEILAVMREEIERLNEIIKNYLSLSKLASANFEKLELNQVVSEFVEEAEEAASTRGVRLDLRLGRGDMGVRADRNMIRRVLTNLVQNGLDATPKGGRVVIGTRRLVHSIKLWVRDGGPGIPAEAENQLFQPFFSTRKRGTGLGLYLIREIVMAHEGRVALRSIKPRGAQATVLLPRWREEAKGKEMQA